MCGIFGATGDLTIATDKFISNMFVMDSLRGMDSCGLVAVSTYNDSKVDTFKRAVLPWDFLNMKQYDKVTTGIKKAYIGHNRWATKGVVTSSNAHPFSFGNITGVHNGTLLGQHRLPDSKDFDVDSENLIYSINEIGIEETWKKVDGAAAVVWWDGEKEELCMIRNSQRPLFFTYTPDLKQVYFASEHIMMQAAMNRNNIKVGKVEDLPVDTLYTFKYNSTAKGKEVVVCNTQKLVPFLKKVTTSTGSTKMYGQGGAGVGQGTNTGISNYKKYGQAVDFMVDKIVTRGQTRTIMVHDNEHVECTYVIEDWFLANKDLQPGDTAVALSMGSVANNHRLNPTTVRLTSEYEWENWEEKGDDDFPDDNNERLPLIVDSEGKVIGFRDQEDAHIGNLITPDDSIWGNREDRDNPDVFLKEDCCWCSSPVLKSESYMQLNSGDVLCEECCDLTETKEYIGDKSK